MPEPAPLPLAPGSSSGSPTGAANAPVPPAGGPAGIRAPNSRPDDAGSGDPASIIARNADTCVCVVSSCPASRQWRPPAGNRRKSTPFQEGEEDGRRVKNGEVFEENPGEENPISNRRFQPSFISPLTPPRLSALSCVPGFLAFLLVLGSVAALAALALKWVEVLRCCAVRIQHHFSPPHPGKTTTLASKVPWCERRRGIGMKPPV